MGYLHTIKSLILYKYSTELIHLVEQRLQKLIKSYLHLLIDCFMKISLQSSELNVIYLEEKSS